MHPPLVGRHHSSERRGRKRPDGRDYPLRLAKFIRKGTSHARIESLFEGLQAL